MLLTDTQQGVNSLLGLPTPLLSITVQRLRLVQIIKDRALQTLVLDR